MAFQINTNIGALNAYNALAKVNAETYKAQLRMATGKRINSVADDTSGYKIGKDLQSKSAVMKASQGNISAAKNLLSTAESALQSIDDLATQINAKITDNQDPTKDHTSLLKDVVALQNEINSIFSNTNFNGTALISTSGAATTFSFQTGLQSNGSTADTLSVDYATSLTSTAMTASTVSGTDATDKSTLAALDVSTLQSGVRKALSSIGNLTQRLDIKNDYLTSAISNADATVSRLFDADMAMEQLNATKGNILSQAGTAMLSQLNSAPQNVLQLFR
ncbi:MAG: flagellin [Syntrophomonadaceae bacterium]